MKLIQQYVCPPGAKILASDWSAVDGVMCLIRDNDSILRIVSASEESQVPVAWSKYVFGMTVVGASRFVVWPVGPLENDRCPIGVLGPENQSTMLTGVPKTIISNGKYAAFCYGEEWIPPQYDNTIYADIVTFYLSKDFSKIGMIGDKFDKINDRGTILEVSYSSFGDDNNFYFIAYYSPYLWKYNILSDVLEKYKLPFDSRLISAILVSGSEVKLISIDGASVGIYSRSKEAMDDWIRAAAPIGLYGHVHDFEKAIWQGKPGGYLLINDEITSAIFLL
jgi:hypothetical protein